VTPAPENFEVDVHSVCGGGINEHVLCGCASMEEDHYECVEEILQRMADDGDETGRAAIALIERLREEAKPSSGKFDEDPEFVIIDAPAPPTNVTQPEARIKLTAAVRRVLDTEGVTHVGWDENNRPVVEKMVGIPQQLRRWAVKRDGDPADIKGHVRAKFDRFDDGHYG
jgi:hypothetical protein